MTSDFRPSDRAEVGLPPHDVGAEEAVLAALLLDDAAIFEVSGWLSPGDFFREQNAWTYEAILQVSNRGEPVTLATVAHELERGYRLDGIGAETYLAELTGKYFTAVGIAAHGRIVQRDAMYRRAIELASHIARDAYAGSQDADALLAAWRQDLDRLELGNGQMQSLSSAQVVDEILAKGFDVDGRRGITCGYVTLDSYLQGFVPGEVVTIGAHTSNGKTAFAVGMALRMAAAGVPVAYVPVEGDRRTLTHRMAAHYGGVSLYDVRARGGWVEGELDAYTRGLDIVAELPIYWPPRHLSDPEEICSWATVQAHQHGVQAVFIDHIDATTSQKRFAGRQAEIANAMRLLERTARREELVIVSMSQVRRRLKSERDKQPHPLASDLREAGDKEELSQVVLMLHLDADKNLWVRVDKCTEGPTGQVYALDQARERMKAPFVLDPRSSSIEEPGAVWYGG